MTVSRDRLGQWLYETMPRRSDVGRYTWDALPDDARGKEAYRQWADALLASKEWLDAEVTAVTKRAEDLKSQRGWIGVDLDGTLAEYHGWVSAEHIGPPIPAMQERVLRWIAAGYRIKIFTARAVDQEQIPPVKAWLREHGFGDLEITHAKDFGMIELWDDRCVQVETNTGRRMDGAG